MSKTNGVHEYPKTKSELNFELKAGEVAFVAVANRIP